MQFDHINRDHIKRLPLYLWQTLDLNKMKKSSNHVNCYTEKSDLGLYYGRFSLR